MTLRTGREPWSCRDCLTGVLLSNLQNEPSMGQSQSCDPALPNLAGLVYRQEILAGAAKGR